MRRLPLLLSDSSFALGIVKPGVGGWVGGGVGVLDSISLTEVEVFLFHFSGLIWQMIFVNTSFVFLNTKG